MEGIIKHWLELIFGSMLTYLAAKVKNIKMKNEATQRGVKAMLRNDIINLYEKYIHLGYMPLYARENLQELYKEYKNLDGNGVIEDLIRKVYALPTEKPIRRERKK